MSFDAHVQGNLCPDGFFAMLSVASLSSLSPRRFARPRQIGNTKSRSVSMRTYRFLFVCTFVAALALPAWSQNANQTSANGILGYLNPRTGSFSPLAQPSSDDVLPALTTVGGKFVVNFTITISSTLPTTDVISCGIDSVLVDLGSGFTLLESAAVAATRTGSSAKCTVTLPYSWTLASQTTDMVSLTYSIIVPATAAGAQFPNRTSNHGFATIKVPANGAITPFNLTATI
jgi:hypothetical protein